MTNAKHTGSDGVPSPLGNDVVLVSRIADDVWNRGDKAVVDEVMAADAVYHGPHMPGGVGDRESGRSMKGLFEVHWLFDSRDFCRRRELGAFGLGIEAGRA